MSERRFNPLTSDWILVSAGRTARPWQGEVERAPALPQNAYDPNCYLCPGNERVNGARNPRYDGTYVFENDFAALQPVEKNAVGSSDERGLFVAQTEGGVCRVVCFSPRHDLAFSAMDTHARRAVIDTWAQEYTALGARPDIGYVQIFENRGSMMGASNPHPHGQIWASSSLPNEPLKEQRALLEYRERHGTCMLCAYARQELERRERIVYANASFAVVVPYWAQWPFETLLLSLAHAGDVASLTDGMRDDLGDAVGALLQRYDALFGVPFPYSMGFHQRPTDGETHDEWHVHAHYYPPLLRSATIRKFAVGYEMLAQPQRDITAEEAAARLRGERS